MILSKEKEKLITLKLNELFERHVIEIKRLEGDTIAKLCARGLGGAGYPFAAISEIYFGKMEESLDESIRIYLDVVAPESLPFSDVKKQYIHEQIRTNLAKYSNHMLSHFRTYQNQPLYNGTRIENDIITKKKSLSDKALRQLAIEQGNRNLKSKFDLMKKRFIWWIKNHRIFSIVLFIVWLIVMSGLIAFLGQIKELILIGKVKLQ